MRKAPSPPEQETSTSEMLPEYRFDYKKAKPNRSSLTSEELRYAESKKLLQLLNELQDPEIIMLRYLYLRGVGDDRADNFYNLHEGVLEPDTSAIDSSDEEINRGALYEAHKSTFRRLGLTMPRSDADLNWLGKMLARYIGIA
jgi:hypothetical protein